MLLVWRGEHILTSDMEIALMVTRLPGKLRSILLVAASIFFAGSIAYAQDEVIEFREPKVETGSTIRTVSSLIAARGDVTVARNGVSQSGTLSVERGRVVDRKVLDADEQGASTEIEIRVRSDVAESVLKWDGEEVKNRVESSLIGEAIVARKGPSGWSLGAQDGDGDEKRSEELAALSAIKNRSWLPDNAVRPGDSWSFTPTLINHVVERDVKAVAGAGRATLRRVFEKEGVRMAEVQVDVRSSGTLRLGLEGASYFTIAAQGIVLVSLETYLDQDWRLEGSMTSGLSSNDQIKNAVIPMEITIRKEIR